MNFDDIIYQVAKREGFSESICRLIVCQAKLESGNYSSNLFLSNNNSFGYKYVGQSLATRGLTSPEGTTYAKYEKVEDSALEICKWIKRRVSENKFTYRDIETPEGYAKKFKESGYYGADEKDYANQLSKWLNQLQITKDNPQTNPVEQQKKIESKQPSIDNRPTVTTPTTQQQAITNQSQQQSGTFTQSQSVGIPTNVDTGSIRYENTQVPKTEREPQKFDITKYDGNYVILNSERIVLNSKKDSIFLLSNKTVGISAAEQVHFNIGPKDSPDPKKHYFIINSPKIQLGLEKDGQNEPVAKADSVIDFINALINALNALSDNLSSATAVGVGVSNLPTVNTAGSKLKLDLKNIKLVFTSEDSPIKSKITNTI